MNAYIFGARATAAGLYKALQVLEPDVVINGFLVSSRKGNPEELWGCPVLLLDEESAALTDVQKKQARIYVAVPELIHGEIRKLLSERGFSNLRMITSREEASIMERYYAHLGIFPSIHSLPLERDAGNTANIAGDAAGGGGIPKLTIYAASFYRDKPLKNPPDYPCYIKKLYVGCDGARKQGIDLTGQADFYDDDGDNISPKNVNRSETTGHYWVWKHRLDTDDEYVGMCHYRRLLDLDEDDLCRMKQNDVDVVLPFPMVHYPNARVHHTWYVSEKDWQTMRDVLQSVCPAYYERLDELFDQPWFYNYNMLIARKEIFADYCKWLFPLLDLFEEKSDPPGAMRSDRSTGYIAENLLTLYFMIHKDDLKIFHTGRLLYT